MTLAFWTLETKVDMWDESSKVDGWFLRLHSVLSMAAEAVCNPPSSQTHTLNTENLRCTLLPRKTLDVYLNIRLSFSVT